MARRSVAIDYFYPNGAWGGYAKFFTPFLPSRIGSPLLSDIRAALDGDLNSIQKAIDTLDRSHSKRVTHIFPHIDVICLPTQEAGIAINHLQQIKEGMQ